MKAFLSMLAVAALMATGCRSYQGGSEDRYDRETGSRVTHPDPIYEDASETPVERRLRRP